MACRSSHSAGFAARGARLVQGVEHPGGAVREGLAAGGRGELGDVARETSVVAVGRTGGGDGPGHRVAGGRPVAGRGRRWDEVSPVRGGRTRPRGRGRGLRLRTPLDLLHRRAQALLSDREDARDVPGETGGLRAVDAEERGERQVQGQAQTGQRVPVDVGAAPVGRGHEGRVGDDLAAPVRDRGGGLEVEQGDPGALLVDHDVAHVQVADDDAPGVYGLDGSLDLPVQLLGPRRVFGEQLRGRVLPGEREAAGEDGVEGGARQVLEDEEVVAADLERVVHGRYAVQSGQLLQRGPLPLQPGDGVGPVGGEPGVGAGLLEDDLLAGAGVTAEVDPAAVGEVERLLDGVRHIAEADGGAGFEVRSQEVRRGHPGGYPEGRAPVVGDEAALRVGDRGHGPPVGARTESGGERPVPRVHRPVPAPQVAEDVRAVLALQQLHQRGAHLGERVLGVRVDGDELAAPRPVRVLGVPQVQQAGGRYALEGQPVGQTVLGDPLQHRCRVVGGGRYVDLPALGRAAGARRG